MYLQHLPGLSQSNGSDFSLSSPANALTGLSGPQPMCFLLSHSQKLPFSASSTSSFTAAPLWKACLFAPPTSVLIGHRQAYKSTYSSRAPAKRGKQIQRGCGHHAIIIIVIIPREHLKPAPVALRNVAPIQDRNNYVPHSLSSKAPSENVILISVIRGLLVPGSVQSAAA
ncbi:hypothetical protein DNTS_028482 [Danionella cerebrum]|uniref:Uncharacterized protein n=1 Tax=Danionella cerebrum TaxID=2873325 RepID=A0A553R7F7_9TELE|nr:hypothetical protein DNTS_028482 [Danionella translucida]